MTITSQAFSAEPKQRRLFSVHFPFLALVHGAPGTLQLLQSLHLPQPTFERPNDAVPSLILHAIHLTHHLSNDMPYTDYSEMLNTGPCHLTWHRVIQSNEDVRLQSHLMGIHTDITTVKITTNLNLINLFSPNAHFQLVVHCPRLQQILYTPEEKFTCSV